MLFFENTRTIFRRKFRETITQLRGVVTTRLVVLMTRWNEAVARMRGNK
jgi:hypothetical protein